MEKVHVARLEEDVKKIRTEIANNNYEVQAAKDLVAKTDKNLELNFKELKQSLGLVRKETEK